MAEIQVYDGDGVNHAIGQSKPRKTGVSRIVVDGMTMEATVKILKVPEPDDIGWTLALTRAFGVRVPDAIVKSFTTFNAREKGASTYKFDMFMDDENFYGCFVYSEDVISDTNGDQFVTHKIHADIRRP